MKIRKIEIEKKKHFYKISVPFLWYYTYLWKRSKKYSIPPSFHFPCLSLMQIDRWKKKRKKLPHKYRGGGLERTKRQRIESDIGGERKQHTSKDPPSSLGALVGWDENKSYFASLCLTLSLCGLFALLFVAYLSIKTWLWELLPKVLWSWKALVDLSPKPSS